MDYVTRCVYMCSLVFHMLRYTHICHDIASHNYHKVYQSLLALYCIQPVSNRRDFSESQSSDCLTLYSTNLVITDVSENIYFGTK